MNLSQIVGGLKSRRRYKLRLVTVFALAAALSIPLIGELASHNGVRAEGKDEPGVAGQGELRPGGVQANDHDTPSEQRSTFGSSAPMPSPRELTGGIDPVGSPNRANSDGKRGRQASEDRLAHPEQAPRVAVGLFDYADHLIDPVGSNEPRREFGQKSLSDNRTDAEQSEARRLAELVGGQVRHPMGSLPGWWVFEFESIEDATNAHQTLHNQNLVLDARLDYYVRLKPATNDPLFGNQWHLKNTGQGGRDPNFHYNVEQAWTAGWTGTGVRVSVLDDGVDFNNPDLSSSHYPAGSYDYLQNSSSPQPKVVDDNHGTPCAGLVGARSNNNIGVAAAAYGCQLSGVRMLGPGGSSSLLASSLSHSQGTIHVYTNSWGPAYDEDYVFLLGSTGRSAITNGASSGRGGLGTVYLFAAGNGRNYGGNANYSDTTTMPEVISVAAVSGFGTYASYSSPGASILIAGFAGSSDIWTTDRVGAAGNSQSDYTGNFSGTSAATPGVAGVVAQVLQARPALTWRDVQHVLARSARRDFFYPYSSWQQNGAGHWISHDWGFGTADAGAATALAQTWALVGPRQTQSSPVMSVNSSIPTSTSFLNLTHTVPSNQSLRCEHVQVVVEYNHTKWGDIEVELVSPAGTVSRLASSRDGHKSSSSNIWTYMTVQNWDEISAGVWTLRVRDDVPQNNGSIVSWRLVVHGTAAGALPEFNAVSFSVPHSSSVAPGGTIPNISAVISNTGPGSGYCNYRMYLSTSPSATNGIGDVLLESTTPLIPAAQSWNGTGLTGQVPLITAPGSYYVYLYITDQQYGSPRVIRSTQASFVVSAPPLPDLYPHTVAVSPLPVVAGQTITLSYSISNAGGTASGSFDAGAYWTTTSTWSSSSTSDYWSHNSIPALTQHTGFQRQIVVPTTFSPGTRYLWVFVDDLDVVSEASESNNRVAVQVQVVGSQTSALTLVHDTPATIASSNSGGNIQLSVTTQLWWQSVAISAFSGTDWDVGMGSASSIYPSPACDFVVANGNNGNVSTTGWIDRWSGSGGAALHYSRASSSSSTMSFSGERVIQCREIFVSSTGSRMVTVSGNSTHADFRWFLFNPGTTAEWRPRSAASYGGNDGFDVGPTAQPINFDETGYWLVVVCMDSGPGLSASFDVVVAAPPTIGSGHTRVTADNVTGAAGTTVQVPVYLTAGTGHQPAALNFDIVFNPSLLTFVSWTDGPVTVSASKSGAVSVAGGNTVRIVIFGLNSNVISSGTIGTLQFQIAGSASPQLSSIAVTNISVSNPSAGNVSPVAGISGSVDITSFHPRDVNRDGVINIVDVQRTVNIVLATVSPIYPGEGDVNGDNAVNVLDVQSIVNCILNAANCG